MRSSQEQLSRILEDGLAAPLATAEQGGGASGGSASTGCSTRNEHYTTHDARPAATGIQSSTHTTPEASGDMHAGEKTQAGGGGAAGRASRDTGKKCEREAGGGQTGRGNEARSATNDATAAAVEQTPLSSNPAVTPAQATNKLHKSMASTSDIVQS